MLVWLHSPDSNVKQSRHDKSQPNFFEDSSNRQTAASNLFWLKIALSSIYRERACVCAVCRMCCSLGWVRLCMFACVSVCVCVLVTKNRLIFRTLKCLSFSTTPLYSLFMCIYVLLLLRRATSYRFFVDAPHRCRRDRRPVDKQTARIHRQQNENLFL